MNGAWECGEVRTKTKRQTNDADKDADVEVQDPGRTWWIGYL